MVRAAGSLRVGDLILELEGEAIDDALVAATARDLGGTRATVWTRGAERALELPPGLALRPTAAPLFLGDGSALGTAPTSEREVEFGWLLAYLRLEGYDDLRVAFHLDHPHDPFGSGLNLQARLLPAGSTPEGFVYVAAESLHQGGGSFFVQEHEVTNGEFRNFRDDGGGQPAPPAAALPVRGVSWHDAVAYAESRNQETGVRDHGWEYRLPTGIAWRVAGYGGDSRAYVFGSTFRPKWLNARTTRPVPELEPVLSAPVDESPWGVFGLAGGVAEWCADEAPNAPGMREVRGGSWLSSDPSDFRVEAVRALDPAATDPAVGFRLVLAPIEAGQ
ncbi:MAG TPA: SUMF1/EgtB/PvdO family nonheme iron enzyme [Planctomycetota bacterium]